MREIRPSGLMQGRELLAACPLASPAYSTRPSYVELRIEPYSVFGKLVSVSFVLKNATIFILIIKTPDHRKHKSDVPGTITYTVSDDAGTSASVTLTVNAPNPQHSGLTWGQITFKDPGAIRNESIPQSAGSVTFGQTGPAYTNPTYAVQCNCSCHGYETDVAFEMSIPIYRYDGALISSYGNNVQANIAAVCAGEAQHFQIISDSVNTVRGHVPSGIQSSDASSCEQLKQDYINKITDDINTMTNENLVLDASGGAHPAIAQRIISGGGY
jgi:hypothetical protein